MRVRAIIAYDGTDYQGFQRQANGCTVQEVLETAVARVTGEATTVLAAGRTDAGVHAEGQVIAFDTRWRHTLEELQRALNAVLPPEVAVREMAQAALGFHPRYDAYSRHYRYTIYNWPVRSPLARRTSLHVPRRLDVGAMQAVAQLLVGEHDFAAFGRPPQGEKTVRRVLRAGWGGESPWLLFDIEANAFLYRMVRSLVGTMIQVGLGRMTVRAFDQVLALRDRAQAGPTAPPHGLCLVEVKYESD
ncbi:MAG TPA: tRNA pseudouridine(38-40) synthase TruA [Chloroflexi bacterium]|nr:tRNA pseudouridine(38-40) synthase TruA [Chloroflexota bacterium]